MAKFEYSGTKPTYTIAFAKELNGLSHINACCDSVHIILPSRILYKNARFKTYRNTILYMSLFCKFGAKIFLLTSIIRTGLRLSQAMWLQRGWFYFRFYVRHICCVNLYIAVSTLSVQECKFMWPSNLFFHWAQKCLKPVLIGIPHFSF